MNQIKTTHDAAVLPAAPSKRARTIALWVLQLALAFQFAVGGSLKLSGNPLMIEMFTTIGMGQWVRFVVGVLELAGALGLLIPRLAGLAAWGLAGLLVGATATNVLILGADPWFPLVLLVVSLLVALGRRQQTRALVGGVLRRMARQV